MISFLIKRIKDYKSYKFKKNRNHDWCYMVLKISEHKVSLKNKLLAKKSYNEFTLNNLETLEFTEYWSFRDTSRKETSYATNSYHRYPAKFIPQIVRELLVNYSKEGDIVLDPFMGSGTTLVESMVQNRVGYGVDINPIAVLISQAKCTPIDPHILDATIEIFLKTIQINIEVIENGQQLLNNRLVDVKISIPSNEKIYFWFPDKKIQQQLAIILAEIRKFENVKIRNFLLCCFFSDFKNLFYLEKYVNKAHTRPEKIGKLSVSTL